MPRPARPLPRAAAVVVAAGRGERLGVPDKVLLPLNGRPMLAHVLDALEGATRVDAVVLVVGEHTRPGVAALVAANRWTKVLTTVTGGERRQDSVAVGLAAVPVETDIVVVHDGARPLAPPALFDRCVEVAAEVGAAIAAIPMADTVKRVVGGRVAATVDRDGLWAAQTPQAFRRSLLMAAVAACDDQVTDEAGFCESAGVPVAIVPGLATNLKVTRPDDIPVAEALLRAAPPASSIPSSPFREKPLSSSPALAGGSATGPESRTVRTGIGYDVHSFAPGRPLVLGGVTIPHPLGLAGHSDADVLLHAVADSLLGAAALGDIGQHFPPSDCRFKDADSRDLLAEVGRLVLAAGHVPVNVDATVIAEAPLIAPHVTAMRSTIAAGLGLTESAVSVKATTNEGMGFVGRGEGIAAMAIATLAPTTD